MKNKFEEALESSGLFQRIKDSERRLTEEMSGEETEEKVKANKRTSPKSNRASRSQAAPNIDTILISDIASYSHPLIEELLQRNGNQKIVPSSGYTTLWDIDDVLAPLQTSAEQCVYRQLYRLSLGFHNTTCFTSQGVLSRRCNLSKGTVKTALGGLLKKKHIAELETVNQREVKGTVFRVFLPSEIDGLSHFDTASEFSTTTNSNAASNINTAS